MLYTLCLKMNQDSNPIKLYMSLIISCSPSIFKLLSCQVCRQVALRNNCMVVDCPHRISMVMLCILSASSLREMKHWTSLPSIALYYCNTAQLLLRAVIRLAVCMLISMLFSTGSISKHLSDCVMQSFFRQF